MLTEVNMDRHEEIKASYKSLGKGYSNLYDGIITRSTLLGKIMDDVIWGLDAENAAKWVNDALSPIPEGFSGKLLEVPVGTGVLTVPVYKNMKDADITCLDYSVDMMKNAKKRAQALGMQNVTFVQGDVGALPFENESFDIVLSLNGFHAFPDKEAAYSETCRVLRKGGIFCGCFYISGEFKRTDRFVKNLYVPKGFFTPPFETKASLEERLSGMYSQAEVSAVRAEGIFRCVK
jgi:ubiquinone/menaquinone biosynthesis C-methylase UbiE